MEGWMRSCICELSDPRWEQLVRESEKASAFSLPGWSRTLSKTYGFATAVIGVESEDGSLLAGVPVSVVRSISGRRRLVSLAFSDYSTPVLGKDETRDNSQLVEQVFRAVKLYAVSQRCNNAEIRSAAPGILSGWTTQESFVIHTLHLDCGIEALFSSFDKKFRQYPRKAERDGLLTSYENSLEELDQFYRLHTLTRMKLGVPVQPRKFFRNLHAEMIAPGDGQIIMIRDEHGVLLSGAIVLRKQRRAMIKYSASNPLRLDSRCQYLLFWRCIEWAHQNGVLEIDFGRTDFGDSGLRKFKSGWSTKEAPLTYSYCGYVPVLNKHGLLDRMLKTLIKQLGTGTCRLIGELFYRYAG